MLSVHQKWGTSKLMLHVCNITSNLSHGCVWESVGLRLGHDCFLENACTYIYFYML